MKIVFIGGRDIHTLGGIENYMYNLATELAKMGHEPVVYCESDHNGKEMVNGFEVRYVKGPRSNLICKPWVGLVATLRTVLKDKDVDFIHYNAWPPSLWCWMARLRGIDSLMEGHGLEWKRSKYGKSAQRLLKRMEKVTAHMNRHLIMCSQDQVKYFKETYGKDAECIPGAVNIPQATQNHDSDVLERFCLTAGKYFLFMGRLVQDKNPDCLIKAFLQSGISGYKLVVAGDNPAMPEYVGHLHELAGGSADVVFTGAVYGADKDVLLANAFFFCLPSTIEGLSIVLMEAMANRLPVIASDIEANRELLSDNAIYVAPEDTEALTTALKRAVELKDFHFQTDENFKTIAGKYNWPAVARKYIELIATYNGKDC